MAIELEFDSAEAKKFLESLQDRQDAISKQTDWFVTDVIGIFVFQDVMDHFKRETGSSGKWEKWSPAYAANARARGQKMILQNTGRLRQNFSAGQWRKRGGNIEWYNNAKTARGFPYAAAHNEGGPILPKRDFMWLGDGAMKKISDACAAFMAGD